MYQYPLLILPINNDEVQQYYKKLVKSSEGD